MPISSKMEIKLEMKITIHHHYHRHFSNHSSPSSFPSLLRWRWRGRLSWLHRFVKSIDFYSDGVRVLQYHFVWSSWAHTLMNTIVFLLFWSHRIRKTIDSYGREPTIWSKSYSNEAQSCKEIMWKPLGNLLKFWWDPLKSSGNPLKCHQNPLKSFWNH